MQGTKHFSGYTRRAQSSVAAFFLVLHDAFSLRFFKTNVLFLYSFFSSTYISFMFPLASFSGVLFSLASFSS
jgi:hypothetical protein